MRLQIPEAHTLQKNMVKGLCHTVIDIVNSGAASAGELVPTVH